MNKDLKRAKSLIGLIHDGSLTDEEYRFIQEAASRYPELKLDIYRHERLHDLLGMVEHAPAPSSLEEKVMSAIRSHGIVQRFMHRLLFPGRRIPIEALGAAAAVVLISVVALTYMPSLTTSHKGTGILSGFKAKKPPASPLTVTGPPAPGLAAPREKKSVEDIALAPVDNREKSEKYLRPERGEKGRFLASEVEEKSLPMEPSPSTGMTAAGMVVTESASKVITPTKSALLMATKSEKPAPSTIFIYSTTEAGTLPATLTVYEADPRIAHKEIIEKMLALGGTITTEEVVGGHDKGETDSSEGSAKDETGAQMIRIPPEKINEFLDWLGSRYPDHEKEVDSLRSTTNSIVLRIDIAPATR